MKTAKSKIIGITGAIGSGKSAVLLFLQNLGYLVFNSDESVNNLYQNEQVKNELIKNFGVSDKKQIKELLRKMAIDIRDLEAVFHKYVFQDVNKFINNNADKPLLFIEMPLLYETNFNQFCHQVIYLKSTTANRINRLMKKYKISFEEANELQKLNNYNENKEKRSDFIIKNDNTLDELLVKIKEVLNLINETK